MANDSRKVTPAGARLLRATQVCERTGISKAGLYNLMAKGLFPRPIPIGLKIVGWLETEIDDWQQSRIAVRGEQFSNTARKPGEELSNVVKAVRARKAKRRQSARGPGAASVAQVA